MKTTCIKAISWLLIAMAVSTAAAQSYDAVADYSTNANPNGAWSYGWTPTVGGAITLYDASRTIPFLGPSGQEWYPSGTGDVARPDIVFWQGEMLLGPLTGMAYSLVRWTAPADGEYLVQGSFAPFYPPMYNGQQFFDADVHVLTNGVSIFDGMIHPGGAAVPYSASVSLKTGDKVDFVAGFGNRANLVAVITQGNRAPVAADQSVTTDQGAPVNITLTATDADNDVLTYAIVAQPTHGTLIGTAPDLVYTPAADYSGADSITFRANDGKDNSNVATVQVSVRKPDIVVRHAELVGATAVVVSYQIDAVQGVKPFKMALYWSQDDVVDSSDSLASLETEIVEPAGLSAGFHSIVLSISLPPPIQPMVKPNPLDHYLLAVADTSHDVDETDEDNNTAWVCPDTGQTDYSLPPPGLGIHFSGPSDLGAWVREARNRAQVMRNFLGPGNDVIITSIIKGAAPPHFSLHSAYEKMDVVIGGHTSWEQLALAAQVAGFWVHAEGVKLCGVYWAPTPGKNSHLDLYNIIP